MNLKAVLCTKITETCFTVYVVKDLTYKLSLNHTMQAPAFVLFSKRSTLVITMHQHYCKILRSYTSKHSHIQTNCVNLIWSANYFATVIRCGFVYVGVLILLFQAWISFLQRSHNLYRDCNAYRNTFDLSFFYLFKVLNHT